MDRACNLSRTRHDCSRRTDEVRLRREAVVHDAVHVKLVLSLDRDIGPGALRMKVEVAWTIAETAAAADCDAGKRREAAVVEPVELERARLFGCVAPGVDAARDEDGRAAPGEHAHLMREDAQVERLPLLDPWTDAQAGKDRMDRDIGDRVEGGEQEPARCIDADVDRALRQGLVFADR